MHENVLAWIGFYINQKFQDTYVHHTSLAPIEGHWSHSFLLKEQTENSLCFVGGAKVKIPPSYNGRGVYIAKCDALTLWLLDFPHDHSTPYDFSTDMTLHLHCVSTGLHFTLHSVTTDMAYSSDVASTTHDTTWHYITDMD